MANSYADPNFNIDTSCNVADLTTLKVGAPDADDKIYVYNGATLTVEQALACLLISLGETSAGAAADGQRVGHVTVNAGVTVTFTGNATATNSGIKSNPASAPGTAGESKSSTLSILGTTASPTVFTNSAGAFNAANRYCFYFVYGQFGTMGVYQINYPSPANGGWIFAVPSHSSATDATNHELGTVTLLTGNHGATGCTLFTNGSNSTRAVPAVSVTDVTVNDSAQATTNYSVTIWNCHAIGGSAYDGAPFRFRRSSYIPPAGVAGFCGFNLKPVAGTTFYAPRVEWNTADVRPTQTVPTGLAVANPSPTADGELAVTWTNAASYAAGDKLVIYNASGDAVLAILDATVGSGRICGLTNGTAYTVYAKATSDNYLFSSATANAGPTTPYGARTPILGALGSRRT